MPRSEPRSSQPTVSGERNTTLDAVRGVAVLGILSMNAVSYGLDSAAYFNLDADGSETWLDWLLGGVGEIFFDQKFMGLFSLLFGAGIVLFADRAEAKGRRPVWFSLWRNLLLLAIGLVHSLFWEGDILIVYALCAPVLLLLRKRSAATLIVLGTTTVLASALLAIVAQAGDPAVGDGYWHEGGQLSDAAGLWLVTDFFFRALGMMLIGVALYRLGYMTAAWPHHRRVAVLGLAVGVPLSALGLAWVAAADFSADVALVGSVPNTIATIPVVLGYFSIITLWNAARPRLRVQAAGQMALTNYLSQTALGLLVLGAATTRTQLAVFILTVWALQLWWSRAWLTRFRYGPVEWLWRSATYRRRQPLRIV